jgi:hypothetical protein
MHLHAIVQFNANCYLCVNYAPYHNRIEKPTDTQYNTCLHTPICPRQAELHTFIMHFVLAVLTPYNGGSLNKSNFAPSCLFPSISQSDSLPNQALPAESRTTMTVFVAPGRLRLRGIGFRRRHHRQPPFPNKTQKQARKKSVASLQKPGSDSFKTT